MVDLEVQVSKQKVTDNLGTIYSITSNNIFYMLCLFAHKIQIL